MSLTFALTGMDPATEAELKAAFEEANARLGGNWRFVAEAEADHVVVDMDSMYGPMSWLKLHASGKSVIGLTAAPRTQADTHLSRPFTADSLSAVLQSLANPDGNVGSTLPPSSAPPSSTPSQAVPQVADPTPAADSTQGASATDPEPPAPVEPPPPPRDPCFTDWLIPEVLTGRRRFKRNDGPALLLDIDARNYHGPANLKPLNEYFEGKVVAEDFVAISDADWDNEVAGLSEAQPLARLRWYGALLSGKGELLPGLDPSGQYHMVKWPQTEREFPKHFRIATAMMKGPATLPEIAAASGVPEADVSDFINASLATGFAELYVEPVEPPADVKSGGLFGRLRGKA